METSHSDELFPIGTPSPFFHVEPWRSNDFGRRLIRRRFDVYSVLHRREKSLRHAALFTAALSPDLSDWSTCCTGSTPCQLEQMETVTAEPAWDVDPDGHLQPANNDETSRLAQTRGWRRRRPWFVKRLGSRVLQCLHFYVFSLRLHWHKYVNERKL